MRLYRSAPRLLKPSEILLIERLLQKVENNTVLKEQLATARVREMEDGGMGSLYFLHPQKSDNERGPYKQVAELEFRDVDGIPVSAVLNISADGSLFELDLFKADFSSTLSLNAAPEKK